MLNRCKKGETLKNGKCIPDSCKVDGKNFCEHNDKPLRPIIARAGGKSQIADKIINDAPKHRTYCEPFVGGGAVYLKKPLAEKNVINDKDKDVIVVYKSFKNGEGFIRCDMTPSKKKFDKIKNKKNKNACDVAYLNKLSFGSSGNNIGNKFIEEKKYKNKDTGTKYQNAHKEEYREKLKRTKVENKDFRKVMKENDSKETFHYLDPPYYEQDSMYKERGVTPEEVCGTAKKMKGKVMISYNDHPEVRKSCSHMKIKKVETRYVLASNSNNKKGRELLITNY